MKTRAGRPATTGAERVDASWVTDGWADCPPPNVSEFEHALSTPVASTANGFKSRITGRLEKLHPFASAPPGNLPESAAWQQALPSPKTKIGGHTGDIAGAPQQAAEAAMLLALVAAAQ